jgi:hypothetical protein
MEDDFHGKLDFNNPTKPQNESELGTDQPKYVPFHQMVSDY